MSKDRIKHLNNQYNPIKLGEITDDATVSALFVGTAVATENSVLYRVEMKSNTSAGVSSKYSDTPSEQNVVNYASLNNGRLLNVTYKLYDDLNYIEQPLITGNIAAPLANLRDKVAKISRYPDIDAAEQLVDGVDTVFEFTRSNYNKDQREIIATTFQFEFKGDENVYVGSGFYKYHTLVYNGVRNYKLWVANDYEYDLTNFMVPYGTVISTGVNVMIYDDALEALQVDVDATQYDTYCVTTDNDEVIFAVNTRRFINSNILELRRS